MLNPMVRKVIARLWKVNICNK